MQCDRLWSEGHALHLTPHPGNVIRACLDDFLDSFALVLAEWHCVGERQRVGFRETLLCSRWRFDGMSPVVVIARDKADLETQR